MQMVIGRKRSNKVALPANSSLLASISFLFSKISAGYVELLNLAVLLTSSSNCSIFPVENKEGFVHLPFLILVNVSNSRIILKAKNFNFLKWTIFKWHKLEISWFSGTEINFRGSESSKMTVLQSQKLWNFFWVNFRECKNSIKIKFQSI